MRQQTSTQGHASMASKKPRQTRPTIAQRGEGRHRISVREAVCFGKRAAGSSIRQGPCAMPHLETEMKLDFKAGRLCPGHWRGVLKGSGRGTLVAE